MINNDQRPESIRMRVATSASPEVVALVLVIALIGIVLLNGFGP